MFTIVLFVWFFQKNGFEFIDIVRIFPPHTFDKLFLGAAAYHSTMRVIQIGP